MTAPTEIPIIPHMDNITAEQISNIRRQAEFRRGYILWIAEKIERTTDELIRKEAAKLLRELVSA